MTMPAQPAHGGTWDAWGAAVHSASEEVLEGRLTDAAVKATAVAAVEADPTVNPTGAWNFTTAPTVAGAPIGTGGGGGGSVAIADLPAGSVLFVDQNDPAGTWPNRPTARTDIKVIWTKTVVGSADPAIVVAPSLTGAYAKDHVAGV